MLNKLKHISIAIFSLVVYFLFSMCLSHVFNDSNAVIAMFVSDVICACIFGFFYWFICGRYHKIVKEDAYHFSGLAICFLVVLFFCNYFTSQMASTYIKEVCPSEYLKVYTNLSGDSFLYYIILALTFGPIVEEILFRGIMYRYVRNEFGILFSVLFSGILFGLSHGTTEHLPIAIGLTFLVCIVYEFTGNLLYCILIHIASNMCSLVFVMTIPIPSWVGALMFAFLLVFMTVLLLSTGQLRDKFRKKENAMTVEEFFNEKKNHWGDDNSQV